MSTERRPEMVILRGLPASGKTGWARAWVGMSPGTRARISKDDLRAMLHDGVFEQGVTEPVIIAAQEALIRELMKRGTSVIVDDTNLRAYHVKRLARIAHLAGWEWTIEDELFDVPVEECVRRDQLRTATVGRAVIEDMHNRFLRGRKLPVPTEDELSERLIEADPYVPPRDSTPAILIDVDGTIALKGNRDPFDETRVHEDQPNRWVIEMIQQDICSGYWPVFCSGRTDSCEAATRDWIEKHVIEPDIYDYALHMRKSGDNRKDTEIKLQIFNEHIRGYYAIARVYDDRNSVVKMWRSLGLNVLQVADGDF